MNILITGAAGFIGSSFLRKVLKKNHQAVVLDKLTYAGHVENFPSDQEFKFIHGCITDSKTIESILFGEKIDWIVNFAAESHVDNSIHSPNVFIETNVVGTLNLLNVATKYYQQLELDKKNNFRFLQVSTDEVFGTLGDVGYFNEDSKYQPNSPYSASKAAADHLVRAWFHTYQLPTMITNCSNNYGPRQFPEKLIPTMILNALQLKQLPVYGNGQNVRDWIYVDDHSEGIYLALEKGKPGEVYCLGGNAEEKNINVVEMICDILDQKRPRRDGKTYKDLIEFVTDRKGHDWRYAIDDAKAIRELGFSRQMKNFRQGLELTIEWYLDNEDWISKVTKKQGGKS